MQMYFDASPIAFYRDNANAKIPKTAKKITEAEYEKFINSPLGKVLGSDESGAPIFIDIEVPHQSPSIFLERAKNELRSMREPMLSAVTGIGWEASEAGDAALVQEARNIRNALRDITDDPVLNSAQTYEEMRAAGMAAFRRIASDASEAFSATFREFK